MKTLNKITLALSTIAVMSFPASALAATGDKYQNEADRILKMPYFERGKEISKLLVNFSTGCGVGLAAGVGKGVVEVTPILSGISRFYNDEREEVNLVHGDGLGDMFSSMFTSAGGTVVGASIDVLAVVTDLTGGIMDLLAGEKYKYQDKNNWHNVKHTALAMDIVFQRYVKSEKSMCGRSARVLSALTKRRLEGTPQLPAGKVGEKRVLATQTESGLKSKQSPELVKESYLTTRGVKVSRAE